MTLGTYGGNQSQPVTKPSLVYSILRFIQASKNKAQKTEPRNITIMLYNPTLHNITCMDVKEYHRLHAILSEYLHSMQGVEL